MLGGAGDWYHMDTRDHIAERRLYSYAEAARLFGRSVRWLRAELENPKSELRATSLGRPMVLGSSINRELARRMAGVGKEAQA
jgi:hypothetical protein